jgi:hypothetical protein
MNRTAKIATGSSRRYKLLAPAFALFLAAPLAAQESGPLTPAPPRQVRRISGVNRPEPTPVPPEQIIRSFAAREDETAHAHQNYSFKRSILFQEFPADGEPGGELARESAVFLATNGRRYERATDHHAKQLLTAELQVEDLPRIAKIPLFPLTTEQIKYYDLSYLGTQPLDELSTYIFQVKPKRLLPEYPLFDGLVYVDNQDLAIVKLYGHWRMLDDEEKPKTRDEPFNLSSLYEIYCENVDEKYWFPTFIRSDEYLRGKDGEDHLRLTVKMTDYKNAPPVPPPTPGAGPDTP